MNIEGIREKASELGMCLSKKLLYHNWNHALEVERIATELCKAEKIKKHDTELVRIGALFHDLGFIEQYESNEPIGAEIAAKWMDYFQFSEQDTKLVKNMILATALPQSPKSHLEQILCDADLDNLGREDFSQKCDDLWYEMQNNGIDIAQKEWLEGSLVFLEGHQFFTTTAKAKGDLVKHKNILLVKSKLELINKK